MEVKENLSLEQIRAFLEGSEEVGFKGRNREEVYEWVNQTLRGRCYQELKRHDRGLVRRYVEKMTGMSRAQITRLVTVYLSGEEVKAKPYRRHRFTQRYLREDVDLLAAVDEAHECLSGPATQKILYRAYYDFEETKFCRLANLSVAQLYRLRKSRRYRERRITYEPTRPTKVSIGERRRPEPNGCPGYLRVDTVHQGDLEGCKGVYHINAVDEVTQWQVVGAAAQISEAYLMPVLGAMLDQFPFRIRGFHSDNGSEFINHTVADLLNKLLIEQTKSRPRRSNDNGLVEAKNGAVIRKHWGYGHIAGAHAPGMEAFYEEHFNEYLNYHRPCGVPTKVRNAKGKEKRVYSWYATPWEILRQLPDLAKHLKDEVTIEKLERRAGAKTDTKAAEEMQEAKRKLFNSIHQKRSA
jgi:transposase InsO family protein